MKFWLLFFALCFVSGCAYQPPFGEAYCPGFFSGIWHGLILPFSLICELFTDCSVYAYPNAGGVYDIGFVLGSLVDLSISITRSKE